MLRTPDLNRPALKLSTPDPVPNEQQGVAPAPTSALYEPTELVDEPSHQPNSAADEQVQPAASVKTWRADSKHEPFRPEKYNSNLTTKLVAGSLSLGAVVLVYFALFGGSGNEPKAQNEWDVAGVDDQWTDDQGELQVDLGTEGEIGESSPLAPPFADASPVRDSNPPALNSMAVTPPQSEPRNTVPAPVETELPRPAESSLTDVLPWRREEALPEHSHAPAASNAANTESFAPAEAELPLNAPISQAVQPQGTYANEYSTGGNQQPTENAAPTYPTTGYGSGQYPATATPASDYSSATAPANRYGAPIEYQARNPDPRNNYNSLPATSGGQTWNAPATGGYAPANNPAGSYSPAAANPYPSTYSNETPREWRR